MAGDEGTAGWEWRARPRDILLRNALLSFVLILLPLFGALYFLGVSAGTWPIVILLQLLFTVVAVAAYISFRFTFVGVKDGTLAMRGFFSARHVVRLSDIHSVVLAETYRTHATDTTHQLLLRGKDNAALLRFRGTFWSLKDMRSLAAFAERPLEHITDPMTSQEFFATYPGSAFWFEDRPALAIGAGIAAFAVSLGVILGLMSLSGIPILPVA